MSAPRVSVIITSYNQQAYLNEAIESVIHQTARPHEIIIADDCSRKDNSVEMINQYAIRHPGWIRPLLQEKNLGIPKNRNSALRLVTGDYVAILDGDDRFLPNNIEMQLAALAEHPEAGCSYSNRYSIDARGERTGVRDSQVMPSGNILFQVACGRVGILRSMIGRYDLIEAAGFLDERFPSHDGFILTLRLAKLTRFIYVSQPLVEKREHAGGDSNTHSRPQKARYFQDVFSHIIALTGHLPRWQQRRIKKIWSRRILNTQVLAELEAGRTSSAWIEIAQAFARNPGNIRDVWRLIRRLLKSSAM